MHFSFVRRMNVELNFFEYAGLLVQEVFIIDYCLQIILISFVDQRDDRRQFIELFA